MKYSLKTYHCMICVHEDIGGGLSHPLLYGGRDDGVQEGDVCSLLVKSVCGSCLCKLSHSFRHCGANTKQGGEGRVRVAWKHKENNYLYIKLGMSFIF